MSRPDSPQDFPEGVEIIIEGAEQTASPASSAFVVPVLVRDISTSEEEEQEDMDDEDEEEDVDGDSEESLECGQRVTYTPGSETQVSGKRKGGVESGEEGSLHIAFPGASEEEVTSSPGLRRLWRVRNEKAGQQKEQC